MTFVEKLIFAQRKTGSIMVVGLDFDRKKVPADIIEIYDIRPDAAIELFNRHIINATAPFCCGWKPNMAFYESSGTHGLDALAKTIAYIREHHPNHLVILDGKRGDIGDTAIQYAEGLKRYQPDAVTVNPYLGPKTIEPFFEAGFGVIALCVTSNPDAGTFQKIKVEIASGNMTPMYLHVAKTLYEKYGATGNLGLVTGATHPEELAFVRRNVGDGVVLLIPGIGKQGGDLEATITNNEGGPAVINVSSAVIFASNGKDYAEAAAKAAKDYNDKINSLRAA